MAMLSCCLFFLWTLFLTTGSPIKLNVINAGSTVKLTCCCAEEGAAVMWFKDDELIPTGSNPRLFGYTMRIRRIKLKQSGLYKCVLKKDNVEKVQLFKVKVIGKKYKKTRTRAAPEPRFRPQVEYEPSYLEEMSGRSVRMGCPATGVPMPVTVWLKDGMPFRRTNGHTFKLMDYWTLYLEDLTMADSGNYTCVVSNPHGHINKTFTLLVKNFYPEPPKFVKGNDTLFVNKGSNLTLDCNVTSVTDHEWVWFKLWSANSSDLNTTYDGTLDSWNYRILEYNTNGSDYKVFNLTEDSSYMCYTRNMYGESIRIVNIKLLHEESIKTERLIELVESSYSILWVVCILAFLALCVILVVFRYYTKPVIKREINAEKTYIIQRKVYIDKSGLPCDSPKIRIKSRDANKLFPLDRLVKIEYAIPVDPAWEISRERVLTEAKIGEGAFGIVFKGKLLAEKDCKVRDVAIKTLKCGHTDHDVKGLLMEMEVMKAVGGHPNIISLLGCCTRSGSILIVMEMAENGNLKALLQKLSGYGNQVSLEELVGYGHQICDGMKHLEAKGYVHRDLAARNILVASGNIMKISDFGLSRELATSGYYKLKSEQQRLPYRWLAPESWISLTFTSKSDVWAYGVLLWEIFTFGALPYDSILQPNDLFNSIELGKRLSCPPLCPLAFYELMERCWNLSPQQRPTFEQIGKFFELNIHHKCRIDENSYMLQSQLKG